jgi:DNA modification methylase
MSYLITLGSRKGDLIYDPFVGSGTTAIASELMERRWIASELHTKSCEIAKARLSAVPQYAELPTLTEVKKMRTRLTQKNLFDYT